MIPRTMTRKKWLPFAIQTLVWSQAEPMAGTIFSTRCIATWKVPPLVAMGTAGKKKPVCVPSRAECCSVSVTTGGIHTRGVGASGRATGPHRAGVIDTGFIEEKWYRGRGSNPHDPKGHRMLSLA